MSNNTDFFRSPHALAGIDTKEPVLVALSGGADSCCLLYAMRSYAENVGCKLYAAHVNHGIRTEQYDKEAMRDEQFCRELCRDLCIELFVLTADVPDIARQSGESLETAARRVRYDFFADVMQKTGIRILATAHNADDNLETQIFNLCRGCSTDGLCGIPRMRPFPEASGVIVRPILDRTKAEILDFCRENGIQYVTDSTNLEDDCTRNRIRHNVIPELVALFGSPQRAAMRLSAVAECDVDFIKTAAQGFIDANGGRLPLSGLRTLHPAVLSRALVLSFKKKHGSTLESVHVSAIIKLIETQRSESSISLPASTRAVIRRGELIFEADVRNDSRKCAKYETTLSMGVNFIDGTDFAVALESFTEMSCTAPSNYEKYSEATLYCKSGTTLTARNRREGDSILDGGVHKKIKKLMCDKKVFLQDRESLPLVCDGDGIIYAPLCAVSDAYKIKSDSQKTKITVLKKLRED